MTDFTLSELILWALGINLGVDIAILVLRYKTWRLMKGMPKDQGQKHRAGTPGSRKGIDMRRLIWPRQYDDKSGGGDA